MNWIHCNTCFTLLSDAKKTYFLTTCGHIFCESCIKKDSTRKCCTCGQLYTGSIALSNQMKPDIQIYFADIKDIGKTVIKQMQQLQQVSEFQKGHIQRLSIFQKHQLGKATELINQAKELDRKYYVVLKENEEMKNFIESQGFNLKDILSNVDSATAFSTRKTSAITPSLIRSLSQQSEMSLNSQASPRSTSINYKSPGLTIRPSPMKMTTTPSASNRPSPSVSERPSPSRSQRPSPAGNQRSMFPVVQSFRNTPKIAPGRVTMRTPPVNGKIGGIRASPLTSPRITHNSINNLRPNVMTQSNSPVNSLHNPRSTHSNSKIAQNLNATKLLFTPRDERRPIQVMIKEIANTTPEKQ